MIRLNNLFITLVVFVLTVLASVTSESSTYKDGDIVNALKKVFFAWVSLIEF